MWIAFIIVVIVMSAAIVLFVSSKNENLFNKKLAQQMLEKDDEYFEVRYLKNLPFLWIILSIPPSLVLFMVAFTNKVDISFGYRVCYFCIALGLVGYTLYRYHYKSKYKIVFDHGRITLYIGKKVKITGTLDQIKYINKPYQVIAYDNTGPRIPYQIIFEEGKKWIEFNEDMDNSYKLVAFFKKGNYFKKQKSKKK